MGDEIHGNGTNLTNKGSPDSPCSKSGSIINNTTSSSNSSNNNNNNNNNTVINNNNNNRARSVFANNECRPDHDRFLPIANVGRIMKKVIPGNGKVSKDAKESVQECVSEFISFVTGEASDKCRREKRKTINGDDIIWAITTLGFENYVSPLKLYLLKYREMEGEKLNIPKQQQEPQNVPLDHSVNSALTHHTSQQPPLVYTNQPFSMPFSPNPIHHQLHQQDQNDSLGQW
ncbi:nuclear transcription factor Y subunit B-3-like [Macadamia integrifolia]|uniref:nuclear transcription factor Y subunit B-3-like n=1 Tax=Macadamia integrifolia TaxID=60698 RepID=UPI001C4E5B6A|nr:nuclear transcription factor Y subunit B-3-like [Macadamia integrifolia]